MRALPWVAICILISDCHISSFRVIWLLLKTVLMNMIFYLIVIIAALAFEGESARAQQLTRLPRIGILSLGMPLNLGSPRNGEAFMRALLELGYVNGKTILFERRSATGKLSLLQGFANDLARLQVSIIVANGPRQSPLPSRLRRPFPLL